MSVAHPPAPAPVDAGAPPACFGAVALDSNAARFGQQAAGFDSADAPAGTGWLLRGGAPARPSLRGAVACLGSPWFRDESLARRAKEEGVESALLAGFSERGTEVLDTLGGAYALAIVEVREGNSPRLLLAIDRMGIGDLFYTRQQGALVFASSLPHLVAQPGLAFTASEQALFDYVWFHMIPAPATVYREVCRLEPGSHLLIDKGEVSVREHARVRFANEQGHASVDGLKPEFRAVLENGVRRLADVDGVGAFLSGGTDSSTVAGYLGEISGRAAQTFSIGFDAAGYDEMEYARLAARHFGCEQHEYYVTPDDIVDLALRVPAVYGQPFGNSSVIPTYYCARMAREHGIRRMLAGDGGDELFGGNARYAKQKVFAAYEALPESLRRAVLEPLADRLGFADAVMPLRKFRRYVEQARIPMPERMESYNLVHWFGTEAIFCADFLAAVDQREPLARQREVWDEASATTMINRMLALDFKFTLADNDLRKVGGMCALAGVEVAYPLLDDDLVDFSARLPVSLKVRGQRLRHFYKEALRDFLPAEVITKSKHGFGLPFGSWVISHARLREFSFDLMSDFRGRGIVRADFIDSLTGKWLDETPNYYGALLWLFMMLEAWYRASPPGAAADAVRASASIQGDNA